ncbi:hypothetical protein K469DRAFT_642760 [Zopfia rhizophila CBS 207.26]|uniref:ARB-07466-like C-terminal domain-containing protein n=1 Tax=Zopfia rhizophila CBS 207.26 TaxID=1314779 RepID=A0A6A6DG10_9PEZI|nr:hypothetical protein K469DRAFT_642760 [Zopfia rhizophila CBS 207.26]
MHRLLSTLSILLLFFSNGNASVLSERATVNGQCTGANKAPGVCIATNACTSAGGTYISNACPGTPNDIKCCTKSACGLNGNLKGANCRWASQCSGTAFSGLCPGPANFKCCVPKGATPSIPPIGTCRKVAVEGAKKIVVAFPGKILEVGCYRDGPCPNDKDEDHWCGMATDFMVSAYGVRTEAGRPIAEWIVANRGKLNLKYVIWGQRIWNPSRDAVKPWAQWRVMDDGGSVTQNHWDHVHVSYS